MTLRNSDLQSVSDLDSIRNSCNVYRPPNFLTRYQIQIQPGKLDKAPRLTIRKVIWILASDTCQLNQYISTNIEMAMLSTGNPFQP